LFERQEACSDREGMLWKERTLRVGMIGALVWLEKRWQVFIVGEGKMDGERSIGFV
jgi:hypothetical protein